MKLQNLHEAKYDQPKPKKGLENLLRFFDREEIGAGEDIALWYVREGLIVFDKGLYHPDDQPQVIYIEFDHDDPRKAKEVMITYQNDDQGDTTVKEIVKNFEVHQTRQLY